MDTNDGNRHRYCLGWRTTHRDILILLLENILSIKIRKDVQSEVFNKDINIYLFLKKV